MVQGGEVLPLDLLPGSEGRWGMVRRFPIGPILAITPFNFPLNLVAPQTGAGHCGRVPCFVEAISANSASALALGRLILEAGWPPEALSVLPMADADAQRLIEEENGIRMLTFTGSARVGWELNGAPAKSTLRWSWAEMPR